MTSRKVLDRILELLDDEVQVVPAVVCEEPRVEGERDLGEVCLRVVPVEVLGLAAAELHHARGHDDEQREQLGVGEDVLHQSEVSTAVT